MPEIAAILLLLGLAAYAGLGLLVGLVYVFGGVGRIDPAAKAMPFRVRLMILPGLIGLWPLMLAKLLHQKEPPLS